MNANHALSLESRFGPPSEPILVSKFIDEAHEAQEAQLPLESELPEDDIRWVFGYRFHFLDGVHGSWVAQSVEDIQASLSSIWQDPRLSALMLRRHEQSLVSILPNTKTTKRRKRAPDEEAQADEQVANIARSLDSVPLSSWRNVS
jgi:hypothetical protein